MKHKLLLSIAALALLSQSTQAKVRLPHLLGDGMILQQDTDVRLWGWDAPGTKVTVTTSWSDQAVTTKTGKDGKFLVTVRTPKASYTPLSVTFDDGDRTTLSNVLSGEVWVCAGQSNMEMPVRGFSNCPVEGYNDVVANASQYKAIHYVKIPSVMSMRPLDDANCSWTTVSPATVGNCSAVGYFFAQTVTRALDIPVGLIMANKGGTRVESLARRRQPSSAIPRRASTQWSMSRSFLTTSIDRSCGATARSRPSSTTPSRASCSIRDAATSATQATSTRND